MNIKVLLIGSLLLVGKVKSQTVRYPYQNRKLPVYKRVDDLVARMNLEEKIDQLKHMHTHNYVSDGNVDQKKLSHFSQHMSFGCMDGFALSSENYLRAIYDVQKYMRDSTRWGIPIIPVMEGLHGVVQDGCTIFPQSIALAATFRPDFAYLMGQVIGQEMNALGGKQVFAPDLDLAREVRWGRVEETYGEDPLLVGDMGVAYAKGLHLQKIITTPKHFIAHGTPIGGINLSAVSGGLRDLYSLYLQPFERVIRETHPLSIMNCYSSYDGEPIAGSPFFLTDLLRRQLKFDGFVYSDWASIPMLYSFHHTAADAADAAYQALTAGLDVEASSNTFGQLEGMVKNGKLDPKYIDTAVRRVLYAKFQSGLFDDPLPDTSGNLGSKIQRTPSVELSRKIADESIVLLKNEKQLLPLHLDKLGSIAVVGPNADETQFGDYTWSNTPGDGITPLEGLKRLVGNRFPIHYAQGCGVTGTDSTGFADAVTAAQKSDIAVVFVGSRSAALAKDGLPAVSGEGYDLTDLHLPGMQSQLVKALYKTGKPIVLVLVTGRPFALSWEAAYIPAIVTQWYGGREEGNSIADMLFGNVNPSGKLPISFPKSTGNLPDYYNYLPSERGYYQSPGTESSPGHDYVFETPGALWPFGYGLSYTKFAFSDFKLSGHQLTAKDSFSASVHIKNTGSLDGAEVIQLYAKDIVSSVETPVRALKAYQKVDLKAGEEKTVYLQVPVAHLALYDRSLKKVVEPGKFKIEIGAASNDIWAKDTVTVLGGLQNTATTTLPANKGKKNTASVRLSSKMIDVSGVVRDIQASVLPDVQVKAKYGNTSVKTDKAGKYHIYVAVNDILTISKTGFVSMDIPVDNERSINVVLER